MRILRRPLALLGLLALTSAGPLRAQSSYEQLTAFSDVLSYIRTNYADSVGYREMVQAAIEGVLRSLDPHSYFLRREDYARQLSFERGELASLGLTVDEVDDRLTVIGILDDGPADRGHVQAGDRLLAIEDTNAAGWGAEEVRLRLSGERGTRIRLTLARGPLLDPDTFHVTLKRETIRPRAVSFAGMADSVTGVIRVAEFTANTGGEVDSALRLLKRRGMRQVVLDLRGNGGGRVFGAIETASLFLSRGEGIFRARPRRGEGELVAVQRDGAWRVLPLILLIDDMTASASEALAGALQDNDRAVLVGRRSFGKALIQQPFVLQTGDVVYLTVAHVLTPSGRSIQRRYAGVGREQYYAMRGTAGDPNDTLAVYHTGAGRPVRGGGGIVPDLEVLGPSRPPAWWGAALDSGFALAVADSVAPTIPTAPVDQEKWMRDTVAWRTSLLAPFLDRVRTRLRIPAALDPDQERHITLLLASRVVEVRRGADSMQTFRLRNDADLQAALAAFPRLPALLAPTRP